MNRRMMAAAALALLTAGVHLVLGGQDVIDPLLDSALQHTAKLTLYGAWHLVTVTLFASAAVLFVGARAPGAAGPRARARLVGWLWCAFGLVFLAVAAGQGGGDAFMEWPQWILLLPVGLLALSGTRSSDPHR